MRADELSERRRNKDHARLPSVDSMLEMFESKLSVHVRVPDNRELITEARRRIRTAAERFGRPVETHYVKSSGMLFGLVPLTDEEHEVAEVEAVRQLQRIGTRPGRTPKK